jgi:hypothetical protein
VPDKPGPDDDRAAQAARDRREFRAWVRDNHPDRGGDPDSFMAGLAAWRRHHTPAAKAAAARAEVTVFRTQHGLWRLRRWRRRHQGTRRVL